MLQRAGLTGTEADGVFLTEQRPAGPVPNRGRIKVEISRQNANLAVVKQQMAREATARGANAVVGFTYGQRAHGLLKLLTFAWDTESWYGEGDAVQL